MDIVIETETEGLPLDQLPDAVPLTTKHFAGGPDLVQTMVTLTLATLPAIAKVIVERIRAKKHVRVIVKGRELDVRGVSEKEASRMVERYLHQILQAEREEV
jgi:hypothetical protein